MQAASPNRFRGIRHGLTWDPHPDIPNNAYNREAQLTEEGFRAGARVLARMGLSFDAWMYFHQLPELVDFARAVPDLTIILNHIGGLLRIGPYADRDEEVLSTWRQGIAAVAQCTNVYVKLGGSARAGLYGPGAAGYLDRVAQRASAAGVRGGKLRPR